MLLPLPINLWTRYSAAHLLDRAGFGGTPDEIESLYEMGPERAVSSLIQAAPDDDLFPPPQGLVPGLRHVYNQRILTSTTDEEKKTLRKEVGKIEREQILALRLWWLNRMRYTPSPLVEKTALFWHGHFATSIQKVNDPYLMWQQNETLRVMAMGKFPALLKAMSRDPAMIRWLDLEQSHRKHPNENFARELMELFSLGEGHYTEKDVQEAARAFTGYRFRPEDGKFHYVPSDFDNGEKSFMGTTGGLDGDQIIDLITSQPQCARFIGRKIWQYFVFDHPSEATLNEVTDLLLRNGYDIAATLSVIFRSAAFYSPTVMHRQIKGPVQWMIQTTKMLEIPLPEAKVLENSLTYLGQVLFAPPNVKGWDGGRSWISASSLLYRYNLATYLLNGKAHVLGSDKYRQAMIPLGKIAPSDQRSSPNALLNPLAFRIFNAPIEQNELKQYLSYLEKIPAPYSDNSVRDLMQIMMSTPSFQLN